MLRINKWAGLVTSASPYILPAGGTVEQINAQSIVPGQISVRPGMSKAVQLGEGEPAPGAVIELWSRSPGLGAQNEFFGYTDDSELIVGDGFYEGGSPGRTATGWESDEPVSFSQSRRGQVLVFQGHGNRGKAWSPSLGAWRQIGIDAPTAAPVITQSAGAILYSVARIDILSFGTNYTLPPAVSFSGGGTPSANASALARLRETSVEEIEVTGHGKGYSSPPTVTLTGGGGSSAGGITASAAAIMRAHLRGVYQCYYRYVDESVPESEGGPIYSSLSPGREVDCGNGRASITWSYTSPPEGSGYSVELWRTTSSQAATVFRVAKIGGAGAFGSTTDSFDDWGLYDIDRTGFSAMPILLPNGELNANRFSPPPSNYAVAVMFQDRLWMAVDTEGDNPNTLRFSEADEPESMPDVNELILQSNLRGTDYITALIPFAGAMIVGQTRHCHRLQYVAQPLIDAGINLLAYRGVLNQRCWDIYEGHLFAMDASGVYAMNANGDVEDLTLGVFDYWRTKIDFSLSKWFSLRADHVNGLLRVNIAVSGDGSSKYPTRQLVYSFDYKTWWEERFPVEITAMSETTTPIGEVRVVAATSAGALYYLSDQDSLTDLAEGSVGSITITNPGAGYKHPPTATASGGHGAEFEVGINSDGKITSIMVKCPGTGYSAGSLNISAPEAGGTQATATFTVNNSTQPVYWCCKTGCMEFVSDSQDKKAGEAQPRQVSVTYQPTATSCTMNLKAYYNNARYPRSNVVRRDRGTGFVHSDEVPAAVLNMQATPLQEAEAHGVARALFTGRTLDDMMGTDRHVSVALSGKQDSAGKVVIHSLDIYGVNQKAGAD